MSFDPDGLDRLNQFALVVYIPDPLGSFLDELRLELAPDSRPHAHVTVLPPRPLSEPWETAAEEIRAAAAGFRPFEIAAGEAAIFPVTEVVYLEVDRGSAELFCMHEALNRARLAFNEPFLYYPHITVAQELPPDRIDEAFAQAARRWKDYTGPRAFRAETTMFVQNTAQNRWIDLVELPLGTAVRV
jgi:2'-5' RNA ligase